ncbi:hypothetical protein AXF42_Ash001875 [Apostasia shenzhenica]|uniref:Uncharacterized protein n=1 Tax=Apostasia shenzhenica TaxID=1088818 RepID=A0A2I0ABI0_9ASPA|nr:hypothetical protein AXF42_Ash001875 [Apostasia shenzhenica]
MKLAATSAVYKSLQSYWRRRAYRRLEDVAPEKKMAIARLGGSVDGRKRRWKVVAARPVRRARPVKIFSPRSLLARLRDGYVGTMLTVAGGEGLLAKKGAGEPVWDRRVPKPRQASLKAGDFEKRMMIHIYNSVIAIR